MKNNLFDKIRNAIYGYNCLKCNSTNILVLIDRKYHCQDCSKQISPKDLSEILSLTYSYYVGQTINQVSKDMSFSYSKVRRFYNRILEKITDESNFILDKKSKEIHIASVSEKLIPNLLLLDEIDLICITSKVTACIIRVKCNKNNIHSEELRDVMLGRKIIVFEENLKKLIQITFPKSAVELRDNPHILINEFRIGLEEKNKLSRGLSSKKKLIYEKEILFKTLYKDDLFNKILTLLFYSDMNE